LPLFRLQLSFFDVAPIYYPWKFTANIGSWLIRTRIKRESPVSLAMTQMTMPRRGRPKGTGIDDRPRLREIAALIAQQPEMRPTTAIKMLGENDPSVIRRLRDKFHALQSELMTDIRRAAAEHREQAVAGNFRPQVAVAESVATEALIFREPAKPVYEPPIFEAPVANQETRSADATAAKIAALAASHPRLADAAMGIPEIVREQNEPRTVDLARRTEAPNPYDMLVGITIEATVTAIEQQMRIYEQAFRLPGVALLLRNQIAVSQALVNIACSAMRANRALAAATS
jgi:hypothetical protein